ncbi:MAG: hypothetical protein IPK64_02325 [bacterium]|nr:hypothetical protein [bacterium]
MKRIHACVALTALILVLPVVASANWEEGRNYFGPSIGLSFLGSAPQFGLNFEHAIETESMGTVGIGGLFRYWSYSEDFGSFFGASLGKWKYSNLIIGVQGNYHFVLDNETIDPWLGLTLAYNVASVSWDGDDEDSYSSPSAGGMWLAAGAGMRYFVNPNMAVVGRLSFGSLSYGALDVGLDFAF